MKILHVISTFPPAFAFGGPPRVAFDLCRGLAKRGHSVEVYTTNAYDQKSSFNPACEQTTVNGIKVTYFPNVFRKSNLYLAPKMIMRMRKTLGYFDIVHTHFGRQLYDIYIGFKARICNVPYILQAHGCLSHFDNGKKMNLLFDRFLGRRILRGASRVIALNRTEVQQYANMGVPREKVAVIPNGIDFSEYENLPAKGSFRAKYEIGESKKIILYLGRIHRLKGLDFLTKAYASLIKNRNHRNATLVIVGPDDGYLNSLRVLIKSLRVEDKVMILGPQYGKDKLEAYVDSDVCVLPSRYEIWGMTILEAYACSKPVVASKVGGLKDLVIDGDTGLLVRPGDDKGLADAIGSVLSNEDMAMRMQTSGKKYVREHFAIETVVQRFEDLYRKQVESGRT